MSPPAKVRPPELRTSGRRPAAAAALALGAALAVAGAPGPGAQERGSGAGARTAAVGEKLQEVEKALEKSRREDEALEREAGRLARQIAELRAEQINAARAAQDHEKAVSALARAIAALNHTHQAKTKALTARRARLAEMLGALERLARRPPEALIALPASPQDTLRSAILLRAAVPALEAQARTLRAELETLAELKVAIAGKRHALARESRSLAERRAHLEVLLERKSKLERTTRTQRRKAAARAQKLAADAKDLRELLARIEAERKARPAALQAKPRVPPALEKPGAPGARAAPALDAVPDPAAPARPLRLARRRLFFPAQGQVVRQFNEKTAFGARSRGITIETLAAAQIIAPYDGRVVFSGTFRDYGQLLIIEHGGGYHTLLAGLHRIDSVTSQWLLAGEPVGVMTRPVKGNPRLYIELRRNGRPINPLPWLAPTTDKVSG